MSIIQRFPTLRLLAFASCLATTVSPAQAALTIDSTRIVHGTDSRNSSVIVANPSNSTFAAQAWVNTEEDDTVTPVPLIASPALFRLDPGKQQMVQINRLPNDLPEDRESLFYFNVQEIPQQLETNANLLNIALRTRIKLFYRPSHLKSRPEEHLKALKWSVQTLNGKANLVVDNPSPYHFTFNQVQVGAHNLQARAMVAPFSQQMYPLPGKQLAPDTKVTFSIINDYGATSEKQTSDVHL
ncbi:MULTISPECIES: molecular chaperone [Pseudomonas]|uniref:fimbrial biogenesis chaperone n=1 Tax=Pseudomonas TaxID=286 RepID=UPI000281F39D|nr:molecular chaperone [Pseudomonas putida]WPE28326.1 putative fimbrial chaperone YadV [Pseudomonas hunanensis]